MITITEASFNDFEQVYPLLQCLNNTTINKSQWKKSFEANFSTGNPTGFLLKDDDTVVGFFGTIFSKRILKDKEIKFCNCHSWIVDENYRSKGLLLLNRVHKIREHVLTVFSASNETIGIYKQLKWKEIDNSQTIYFSQLLNLAPKTILTGEKMWAQLNTHEKQIALDHKDFNCRMNILKSENQQTFQIFKSINYFPSKLSFLQKIIPNQFRLGQLYYISNPQLFFSDFKRNVNSVCRKENWLGVIIPNRLLDQYNIPIGKKYFKYRPIYFKTDNEFEPDQLDMLYSEIFVLDLN